MLRALIAFFISTVLIFCSVAQADDLSDMKTCAAAISNPANAVVSCGQLLNKKNLKERKIFLLMARGSALLLQGQSKKAMNDFNKAVEADNINPLVFEGRAIAWEQQGFFNRCIADASTGIHLKPDDAIFYTVRATCYYGNDDDEHAVIDGAYAIKLQPDLADHYAQYAKSLMALGKSAAATEAVEKAILLAPKNVSSYSSGYVMALDSGNTAGATNYIDRATIAGAASESTPWVHYFRGVILRQDRKFEQALNEFDLSQKLGYANISYLDIERARVYLAIGNNDLALKTLNAAIATTDNAVAFMTRGALYLKMAKPDLALADFNKALASNPRTSLYLSYRGHAYLDEGDMSSAQADFDAVLSRKPTYVAAIVGRARIAAMKGDSEVARRTYQLALGIPVYRDYELMQDFQTEARHKLASLPPPLRTDVPDVTAAIPVDRPKREAVVLQSPKPIAPTDPVKLAVFQMLDKHCARCHQTDKKDGLSRAQKILSNVLDLDADAANKKLIAPGRPDMSTLYFTILRREMPYDVYQDGNLDNPMPDDNELNALRVWITSIGNSATVKPRSVAR